MNRHLKVEFDKRTSNELTQAVPPTETLNSDPAKERAGLARQGSLAERQPPAALVQKRQQINNDGFSTANDIPVVQVSHNNTDKLVKSKKNLILLLLKVFFVKVGNFEKIYEIRDMMKNSQNS